MKHGCGSLQNHVGVSLLDVGVFQEHRAQVKFNTIRQYSMGYATHRLDKSSSWKVSLAVAFGDTSWEPMVIYYGVSIKFAYSFYIKYETSRSLLLAAVGFTPPPSSVKLLPPLCCWRKCLFCMPVLLPWNALRGMSLKYPQKPLMLITLKSYFPSGTYHQEMMKSAIANVNLAPK